MNISPPAASDGSSTPPGPASCATALTPDLDADVISRGGPVAVGAACTRLSPARTTWIVTLAGQAIDEVEAVLDGPGTRSSRSTCKPPRCATRSPSPRCRRHGSGRSALGRPSRSGARRLVDPALVDFVRDVHQRPQSLLHRRQGRMDPGGRRIAGCRMSDPAATVPSRAVRGSAKLRRARAAHPHRRAGRGRLRTTA